MKTPTRLSTLRVRSEVVLDSLCRNNLRDPLRHPSRFKRASHEVLTGQSQLCLLLTCSCHHSNKTRPCTEKHKRGRVLQDTHISRRGQNVFPVLSIPAHG